MDFMVVQYVGFVVTALVLIWAVIEINKRLARRDRSQDESPQNWAELDTKRPEAREERSSKDMHLDQSEEGRKGELQARAMQNGHHHVES
jgi:flagellar biosynthesis/type III secretory pathway M-ring protein FliF/YscJ